MKHLYLILTVLFISSLGLRSQSTELVVTSSLDNTIFKELELSNGIGEYIFTGTSNLGVVKRALVQFDLADVPAGIQVDSAVLILKTIKVKPESTVIEIFRALTEWGEGTSRAEDGDGKGAPATAGDATWTHAKFPTVPWIKSGGDFEMQSSASDTVSFGADAVFASNKLTLDVNYWLQNPLENYGWILIGDEVTNATSSKFGSRDHNDNLVWPALKMYFQGANAVDEKMGPGPEILIYQSSEAYELIVANPFKQGSAHIEIFSITGSRLWSSKHELISGNNHISTGELKTGIYLYRISLNGTTSSGKLLLTSRR
jgi:hypothetical protein